MKKYKRNLCLLISAVLLSFTSTLALAKNERLVVMDFGALDTLTELGVKNRVIAIPKTNTPDYLKEYLINSVSDTGGMKEPNLTLIKESTPDAIIISGRQSPFFDELQKIAPTYQYTLKSENYLTSAKENILAVGEIVGLEDEAKLQWDKLEEKVISTQLALSTSPLKALVILHNDGKFMASNSSYANFIHSVLGVKKADENLSKDRIEVTEDYLIKVNPDVIFIIDRSSAIGATPLNIDDLKKEPLTTISAVKNERIIYLDPTLWYLSGNGLQSIRLQINEVEKAMQ